MRIRGNVARIAVCIEYGIRLSLGQLCGQRGKIRRRIAALRLAESENGGNFSPAPQKMFFRGVSVQDGGSEIPQFVVLQHIFPPPAQNHGDG